jgi:hypothetical protein
LTNPPCAEPDERNQPSPDCLTTITCGRHNALAPDSFKGGHAPVDSELELSEVFRLGEAAGEEDIVREVGDQLSAQWLRVSRFRKVQALTSRSLVNALDLANEQEHLETWGF